MRPGGVADIGAVDIIMNEAFDPRFGEAWTRGQCLAIVALPGIWLTMADVDGHPAGFALCRAAVDEAELLLLATRPSLRRRGIGNALLRTVIHDCEVRRIAKLHLEVRAGNRAIDLYRQAGFVKVGERRDYYRGSSGQVFDALTFSHEIG
ncbi:MAG: GNAT family N-acetyltransferase [Sphingomonas sp.]